MVNAPVLVVGGTGMLGSQVVTELLKRGKHVRALVRTGSDASTLEAAALQRQFFGEPPTAEIAIRRFVAGLGHTHHPGPRRR